MPRPGRSLLDSVDHQMIAFAASGLTDKEICHRLGISYVMITNRWRRLRIMTGCSNKAELLLYLSGMQTSKAPERPGPDKQDEREDSFLVKFWSQQVLRIARLGLPHVIIDRHLLIICHSGLEIPIDPRQRLDTELDGKFRRLASIFHVTAERWRSIEKLMRSELVVDLNALALLLKNMYCDTIVTNLNGEQYLVLVGTEYLIRPSEKQVG